MSFRACAAVALAAGVVQFAGAQGLPVWRRLNVPDQTPARTGASVAPIFGGAAATLNVFGGSGPDGRVVSTQTTWLGGAADPAISTITPTTTIPERATLVSTSETGTGVVTPQATWAIGGIGQNPLQVRRFDGSTWTTVATTGTVPPARHSASGVYVPRCDPNQPGSEVPCIILFGGQGATSMLGDVWVLWTTTMRWESIPAAAVGAPTPRTGAVAALSSDGTYVIFYGGVTAAGPTNDVWMFAPSGLPDARFSEMTNVALPALGAVASESSTDPTWSGPRGAASAIDGFEATTNGTQFVCTHTLATGQASAWWRVDFGQARTIGAVQIFPRTDNSQGRFNNYRIIMGNDGPGGPTSTNNREVPLLNAQNTIDRVQLINFQQAVSGRFLWVYLVPTPVEPNRILTICEFRAFVRRAWSWRRLSGVQNVALNKPAAQSSIETCCRGGAPSRAVDGGEWHHYDNTMPGFGDTCAHTANVAAGFPVWWRVDLGQVYDISAVEVFARLDCCTPRNLGVEIYIGNSQSWQANQRCNFPGGDLGGGRTSGQLPSPPAPTATVNCPTQGRYVIFRKPNLSGGDSGMLMLCEVRVQAEALPNMPLPARDFSATLYRGNLVLFGGVDTGGFRSNALRFFNVDTRSFTPVIVPLGESPVARSSAVLAPLDGTRLLLAGGSSNSDVLSDGLTLSFPTCPTPANMMDGVMSFRCTMMGTSCVYSCSANTHRDMNRGRPVVCREDGMWSGVVPPCQPVNLAAAPQNIVTSSDASSVNVSWTAPINLGWPFGSAVLQGYQVSVSPDGYFERFVDSGLADPTAWKLMGVDNPTTSSIYIQDGKLIVEAGQQSDYWMGLAENATHGVFPAPGIIRRGVVLYRDWPQGIDPLGDWTMETEMEIVLAATQSGVSFGLFDTGAPLPPGFTGGELQVMWGFRYIDGGANGAPTTLSLESMGGRIAVHIPLPNNLPRKVQVRIERVTQLETDREGNPIYRFWYRFNPALPWTRVYQTVTLYDTLWSPLNTTSGRRFGFGMNPLNLRPAFFSKTWTNNNFAKTIGGYSYLSIFQGLGQDMGMPTPPQVVGPTVTNARFINLSPATRYRVSVQAITQSGRGTAGVAVINTPPVPLNTALFSGPVVNAALRKVAFARDVSTQWGAGITALTDGVFSTTDPLVDNNFAHSNTNGAGGGQGPWFGIDLGVPYAAVKQAWVVNRCEASQSQDVARRYRNFNFFVGQNGLSPWVSNAMIDYNTWGPLNTTSQTTRYTSTQNAWYNTAGVQSRAVWPVRGMFQFANTQATGNDRDCTSFLPAVAHGRYGYTMLNYGEWLHLRELGFMTANACPARTVAGLTGSAAAVPAPAGTRSCGANSPFGSVCEYMPTPPAVLIAGSNLAVCNGEQWWSTRLHGAAPYYGTPCVDIAAPAFADTVAVEMLNEDWVNFPIANAAALRTRQFVGLFPWTPLWTMFTLVNNAALVANGRPGATQEASAVFANAKIAQQVDYSTRFEYTVVLSTMDQAGLYFRVVDEQNWYRLVMDPTTGYHFVQAAVAGNINIITDARDNSFFNDQDMTVTVSMLGPNFNVTVNGRPLLQSADRTFSEGIVGIYSRGVSTFKRMTLVRYASSCNGVTEGETCILSCLAGMTQVGPARRTCNAAGGLPTWSQDPTTAPTQCVLQPPIFPTSTLPVPENSARNTLVGSPLLAQSPSQELAVQYIIKQTWWGMGPGAVLAADNSLFAIDSCTGQVRVRTAVQGALDFEIQRNYLLTVSAFIPGFPTAFTDTNITVQLLNVDEPPIIVRSVIPLRENGGVKGDLIGSVQWWDPENDTVAMVISVDGSGGRFSLRSLSATNIAVQINADPVNTSLPGSLTYFTGPSAPLSFERPGSESYSLILQATQVTGDTSLVGTGSVTVQITDVNDAPIVPAQTFFMDEVPAATVSAAAGAVQASDEDAGVTTLTFAQVDATLCGEANPRRIPTTTGLVGGTRLFAINAGTGALTVAAPPPNGYALRNPATGQPFYPPFISNSIQVRAVYTVCVSVSDGMNTTIAPMSVAVRANDPGLPFISTWAPTDFPTVGGTRIVFQGRNLFTGVPKVVTATYSNGVHNWTATGCTALSANNISCFTVAGVGQRLRWTIRIDGEQVLSTNDIFISYTLPNITSVSGHTGMATSGNSRITILGSNFGNTARNIAVSFGPTGWEFPATFFSTGSGTSHNTILVNSFGQGGGENLLWYMIIGGTDRTFEGNVVLTIPDVLWSYSKPTISTFRVWVPWPPYDVIRFPTQGGLYVQINGTQFGGTQVIPEVRFGPAPDFNRYSLINCFKNPLSTQTSVTCQTPPGAGGVPGYGMRVCVMNNCQVNTFFAGGGRGITYNNPAITRVFGEGWRNANTDGGQVFTLEGSEFGPVGDPAEIIVTYGFNASDVTRYTATGCVVRSAPPAMSTVQCITAPGVGSGLWYRMSVGGVMSPIFSGGGSYGAPVIASLTGPGASGGNTLGGQEVVLSGKNFGPADPFTNSLLSVFYGSDLLSSIRNDTNGLVISRVAYTAASCRITVAHSEIRCNSAVGAGTDLRWDIVLAGQRSTTPTTTYAPPLISAIDDGTVGNRVSNANVNGGSIIFLRGSFFGPSNYIPDWSLVQSVSFGISGTEYSVPRARKLGSGWDDSMPGWSVPGAGHDAIRVVLPAGFGSELFFRIVVADQVSNSQPTATFSYTPPRILAVTPNTASSFSSPRQPTLVTLRTLGLPFADAQSRIGVVFGNAPFTTVLQPILPQGVAQIQAATDPLDGSISFRVPLPTHSGGLKQSFQLTLTPATAPSNSPPTVTSTKDFGSEFNYLPVKIDTVVLTRARFLPAGQSAANNTNTDLIPCPWTADPQFECDNPATPVYQMSIIGDQFTSASASLMQNDGFVRRLELVQRNWTEVGFPDVVPNIIWSTQNVRIQSWEHQRIVAFVLAPAGTLRLGLSNKPWDGPETITQEVIYQFRELNPEVSGLRGPVSDIATAGGSAAAPLVISVSNLGGAAGVDVFIGGASGTNMNRTKATLLDSRTRDAQGRYLEMTTDTAVLDWLASQLGPATANGGVYEVFIRIPPGQGLQQPVIVSKRNPGAAVPVESNSGFTVSYAAPVLRSVQVIEAGAPPGPVVPVSLSTVVEANTDGRSTRIRLIGENLGTAPWITSGDGVVTRQWDISACAGADLYTCWEFTAPEGEGTGALMAEYSQSFPVGYRLFLEAGDQSTARVTFKYAAPVVSTIVSSTGLFPTAGGVLLNITGFNFGSTPLGRPVSTKMVHFGRASEPTAWLMCLDVHRVSHTLLQCTLPEGAGRDLSVRVTIDDQQNSAQSSFSYNPPVIASISIDRLVCSSGSMLACPAAEQMLVPGNLSTPAIGTGYTRPMAVAGTNGGDVLTIVGSNFGVQGNNSGVCAFLMWAFRPLVITRVPTCDGWESFWGEGEVAVDRTISWTHGRIVMRVPPGLGFKDIELSVRGNTLGIPQFAANLWRVQYEAPVIMGLWTGPSLDQQVAPEGPPTSLFDTEGGEVVSLWGANMGPTPRDFSNTSRAFRSEVFDVGQVSLAEAPSLPTAALYVVFNKACVTNSYTLQGTRPGNRQIDVNGATQLLDRDCDYRVSRHEQNRMTLVTGSGVGRDKVVYVVVAEPGAPAGLTLRSNIVPFSYMPPRIETFRPQPVFMAGSRSEVKINGRNFGNAELAVIQGWSEQERELKVDIAGDLQACITVDRFRENGRTVVTCDVDHTRVQAGHRNVSLTAAGQTGRKEAFDTDALLLVCARGFYGRVNETCLPCPSQSEDPVRTGADCEGYLDQSRIPGLNRPGGVSEGDPRRFSYPKPRRGFYNLNSSDAYTRRLEGNPSMLGSCPDGFRDAGRDVCIVPCDPPESCLGDNWCAEGYTSKAPGFRCASCDKGYYRRAGECIKCPDSPAALFVGFILLVIFVAVVGFFLNKKQINIAVLSIGVDFFQVLAIFAQARVKWPPIVKEILHVLSAFNLNIEIVAPECLIPDVSYRQKFWFIMLLPLCISSLFLLSYVSLGLYKGVILGQPKKMMWNHKPTLVSSALVLLYLLYLYLTRTIFDVFNCGPTFPSDGKQYLQVVFPEECGVPGGTQLTLLPYAIAGLAVYTFGYPAFIGYTIWKNREIVMEDQLLRAKGTGNDRLSNPHAYELRMTYGRSYFQFKPDWCLWILAIILRKFFIAITAVVFGKNSSFQMAACLLIMFLAYAAQVQIRPYMGAGDFDEVLASHVSSSYISGIHARLRTTLANVESRQRKKAFKNIITFDGKVNRAAVLGVLTGFFFNYNTVEAIMQFCAVIVCLMAIMYQANELTTYYPQSKDSVTAVLMIIIIWAIVYFFTVLITEIHVLYNEDVRARQLAKQAKNRSGKADKKSSGDENEMATKGRLVGDDGEVQLGKLESATNPMFLKMGGDGAGQGMNASISSDDVISTVMSQRDAPTAELWRVFQSSFAEQHGQIKALKDQVSSLKKQAQNSALQNESTDVVEGGGRAAALGKAKTQFAPKGVVEGRAPVLSTSGGKGSMSLAAMKRSSGSASKAAE